MTAGASAGAAAGAALRGDSSGGAGATLAVGDALPAVVAAALPAPLGAVAAGFWAAGELEARVA